MRLGFLGPEGTFTHEALGDVAGEPVPLPTVHDTVMAVHDGRVDRALVPIENSLEGAVNATLDALAIETDDLVIVGEVVHPVHHCLIAAAPLPLDAIEVVASHPQANGQCARFLRSRLPQARVVAVNSTAEAVRSVVADRAATAALGNHLSAGLYDGEILLENVEDDPDNATRFVWIARTPAPGDEVPARRYKTSVVWWGSGDDAPGWLVRCLSEFAFRGVNLTRIESRPRKQRLGHYMFFADLEGRDTDEPVRGALEGLRNHAEQVRDLGSYPAA
jgi:prephenate dehydratase